MSDRVPDTGNYNGRHEGRGGNHAGGCLSLILTTIGFVLVLVGVFA